MSSPYKKVAFYTLGCKLNFTETSTIARDFVKAGYIKVNFKEDADIYVINTCSVTENADNKAQKLIKKIKLKAPDSYIAVVGCYAQLQYKKISEIPGVNIVLGAEDKFNLPDYINNYYNQKNIFFDSDINRISDFEPSYSLDERTRSFVKIQDGCDYSCSFCTIPIARGRSRSGTISEVVKMIKNIGNTGVNEVVLSGINVGDFGVNNNESLIDLLQRIELLDGIKRFRISSIEPNLLSDEIINFIASSKKILPHFHVPLQSGSDKILKLMKRRYKSDLYALKIKKIKDLIPNASIGVDVIVGFPSETDEDFLTTYDFLNNLDITYLHVFSYSERQNTKSISISNRVADDVKKERRKLLSLLSDYKKELFIKKNLKKNFDVLFEAYENGYLSGLTDNYIRVHVRGNKELINKICKIKLIDFNGEFVKGEIIH